MVAIFTGFGAGVERGSANVLGGAGQLGGAGLGRGGENVSVNAATGNLVISRRDEFLTGVGPDASVSRSYNSLAHTDDRDNGDGWQQSTTRRVLGLYGTANTSGSTIQRLGADGSVVNYAYGDRDGETAYWAIDGAGIHDRLDFDAASDSWTWTDGDSLTTETYASAVNSSTEYRLVEVADVNDNKVVFAYHSGTNKLYSITTEDPAGALLDKILYTWDGDNITKVTTVYTDLEADTGRTLTRTYYTYDTQDRLTSVTTDLSPDDNAIVDGEVYTINYEYDGSSNRVSRIWQDDLSDVAIAYNQDGRIASLTQLVEFGNPASSRSTSFAYHIGYTVVTAPDATQTRLDYDAGGRLLQITSTPPGAGMLSQIRQFEYDSDGNVERVIESEMDASLLATTAETGGLDTPMLDAGGSGSSATFANTGRGSNEIAASPWPSDTNHGLANGTLPAGWSGWGASETNWQTSDAPYSASGANDAAVLNVTNNDADAAAGNAALSNPLVLDGSKAYEYTVYFQRNTDDDFRVSVGPGYAPNVNGVRVPTFKNASDGSDNIFPRSIDRTTDHTYHPTPFVEGKWYKLVAYILPEGTAAIGSSETRGGIYDLDTGAKMWDSRPLIWHENRHNSEANFILGLGGLPSGDGSEGGRFWKPEIREVTDTNYILANNDALDIAADAALNGLGGGGGSGNTSAGANVPTGAIAGAPTITYDVNGRETSYEYDTFGNVTKVTDPNGNITLRFYDSDLDGDLEHKDRLIREEWTGNHEGTAGVTRYSHYVYDNAASGTHDIRLAFALDPEGRVSEYRYNNAGQIEATIGYPEHAYSAGATTPSLTDLNTWRDNLSSETSRQVTRHEYDARGNMLATHQYSAAPNSTAIPTGTGDSQTSYIYDQAGRLLSSASGNDAASTFAYDGLGRLISSIDGDGKTVQVVFNDAASKTVITNAANFIRTETYNLAGELIASSENTDGYGSAIAEVDTAGYEYDDMGRLRVFSDARGDRTFYVYDDLGRQTGVISEDGFLSETIYDEAGRIAANIVYANDVAAHTGALADVTQDPKIGTIRPTSDATDNWAWSFYDEGGRVIQTVDSLGAVTEFEYDASNNLMRTIAYDTRATNAEIEALKNDATIGPVATPATSTQDIVARNFYDLSGRMIAALDGEGFVTEMFYDEAGQMVSQAAYAVQVTSSTLRATGTLSAIKAVLGTSIRQGHSVYDGQGLLRYQIDNLGYVTGFEYDDAQRVTLTTAYASAISPADYTFDAVASAITSSAADRSSTTNYDSIGRVASTVSAVGLITSFGYDAHDNVRWVQSDDNGALRISHSFHDAEGQLRYSVDAGGFVTRFDYDQQGNTVLQRIYGAPIAVTQSSTLANVESALAGSFVDASFTYDNQGRLSSSTNGEGEVTEIAYNSNSTVAVETMAFGSNGDESITSYSYDAAGRAIATVLGDGEIASQLNGAAGEQTTSALTYDTFGRTETMTDGRGVVTQNIYDNRGQLIEVIEAIGTGEQRSTKFEYNAFGEVVKTTDPREHSSYNYYDDRGQLVLTVDAENYVTTTGYNVFGEISEVRRFHNTATNVGNVWNLPSVVADPAKDAITYFSYDTAGRLVQTTDAEGFTQNYTYNGFGERVSSTAKSETTANSAGANNITTYVYDERGMMVAEVMPTASHDNQGIQQSAKVGNAYLYDARGNRIEMIEALKLTGNETAVDIEALFDAASLPSNVTLNETRRTAYVYDSANRLIQSQGQAREIYNQITHTTLGLQTPTEFVEYDERGNVSKTVDASGAQTFFFYDDLGRKIVEIDEHGTYTAHEYDENGNVTRIRIFESPVTLPAGGGGSQEEAPIAPSSAARETLFEYDALGRMTKSSVVGVHNGYFNGTAWAANADNFETEYKYDANGNVIKTTDPMGNETFAYYDNLNRKTGQVDALNHYTTWEYDSEGNVLVETQFAATVSNPTVGTAPADPSLTDARITQYTYDEVGNRLTETRLGIEVHDAANVGTSAVVDGTVSYTYNGLGQVLTKSEATGDTIAYAYDDGGRLTDETRSAFSDHNGVNVTPEVGYFYNGLGNLSRTVAAPGANERVSIYEYNAGGLLAKMTDAAGNSHDYYYDASGRQLVDQYTRTSSDGTQHTEASLTRYDLLGRVTEQKIARDVNGTWQTDTNASGNDETITQTEYNAFGDVIRTGINGNWIGENKYDLAGRMWASDAGDGVWKYFGYDKNGNQTLAITSAGAAFSDTTTFQNAYDGIGNTDTNATFTVYDARNMALEVHEEQRELAAGLSQDLTTSRSYNAFGEVNTETDARGAMLSYTYNTMGRMIRSESPTVSITYEDGSTQWVKPSEDFYYDVSGRLVAQRDANGVYETGGTEVSGASKKLNGQGNLTRLELLDGTGYGGSEALITKQISADGGITRTSFDIHGDAREIEVLVTGNETAGTWRNTAQSFDNLGRLTTLTQPNGLVQHFEYDEMGQRTAEWNSFLGAGNKQTTDYDKQGRVIETRAFGGDITTMAYGWDGTLEAAGTGLTNTGGWVQTTVHHHGTTPIGRSLTETADLFGRAISKNDLGSHVTTYGYDAAGRQTTSTMGGSTATYAYFNTGQIGSNTNLNGVATYEYDEGGNRTAEKLTNASGSITFKDQSASYDLLGRMTDWDAQTTAVSPDSWKSHQYDANGNIRYTQQFTHALGSDGQPQTGGLTRDFWFSYDSMNRLVTDKGQLSGAAGATGTVIVRGYNSFGNADYGRDVLYDKAGQRVAVITTFVDENNEFVPDGPGGGGIGDGGPSGTTEEPIGDPGGGGGGLGGGGGHWVDNQGYRQEQRENYIYNDAGQLTDIKLAEGAQQLEQSDGNGGWEFPNTPPPAAGTGGALASSFTYDALGRQILEEGFRPGQGTAFHSVETHFNEKGQVIETDSSTLKDDGKTSVSITRNDYGVGSGYAMGQVVQSLSDNYLNDNDANAPDTALKFTFKWYDSAVQNQVQHDKDYANNDVSGTYGMAQGTTLSGFQADYNTFHTYNNFGQLISADVNDGLAHDVDFTLDELGQIIRREETVPSNAQGQTGAPVEVWYRYAGREMGYLGNNSTTEVAAQRSVDEIYQSSPTNVGSFRGGYTYGSPYHDFNNSYDPLNAYYQGSRAGSYTVRGGESLQAIAASVYGDSNLWYKIAEANGLSGGSALAAGQTIRLPAGVVRTSHNAETFKPYDPGQAIGELSPTTPTPKKGQDCGVFGQILLIVIAVAVTVATAGKGAPLGAKIGAAALGSAVSQGVGVATGIQEKFSFKSVALSALSAGVTHGLIGAGGIGGDGGLFGAEALNAAGETVLKEGALGTITSSVLRAGVSGAVGSAITQGIATATGLQDKFSWAGVAAAGVSAGVGSALGGNLDPLSGDGAVVTGKNIVGNFAVGAAKMLSGAATRSAIEGSSFGRAAKAGIPDVIGNVLGELLGGALRYNRTKTIDRGTQTSAGARQAASGDEVHEIADIAAGPSFNPGPLEPLFGFDVGQVEVETITLGEEIEATVEETNGVRPAQASASVQGAREGDNTPGQYADSVTGELYDANTSTRGLSVSSWIQRHASNPKIGRFEGWITDGDTGGGIESVSARLVRETSKEGEHEGFARDVVYLLDSIAAENNSAVAGALAGQFYRDSGLALIDTLNYGVGTVSQYDYLVGPTSLDLPLGPISINLGLESNVFDPLRWSTAFQSYNSKEAYIAAVGAFEAPPTPNEIRTAEQRALFRQALTPAGSITPGGGNDALGIGFSGVFAISALGNDADPDTVRGFMGLGEVVDALGSRNSGGLRFTPRRSTYPSNVPVYAPKYHPNDNNYLGTVHVYQRTGRQGATTTHFTSRPSTIPTGAPSTTTSGTRNARNFRDLLGGSGGSGQ